VSRTNGVRKAYGLVKAEYDKGGNRTSEQIDLGVSTATHNTLNQMTSLAAAYLGRTLFVEKGVPSQSLQHL